MLLAAIAGGVVAILLIGGHEPTPTAAAATTAAQPPATIDADDITPHLDALAAAGRETAGRAPPGTPGDEATRAHVVDALRAAGWRVTVQPVRFPYFDERRAPRVTLRGGRRLAAGREVRTLAYSAGGRATGAGARDHRRPRTPAAGPATSPPCATGRSRSCGAARAG